MSMRLFSTLVLLLVAATIFSQTADVSKGCAPLEVKFTPPAGAVSFFWDFKDGGTSNLQSPSNIFTQPGTYNVEFKNSAGGPVVGTIVITVFPKPVVTITAVPESGCRPLPVQFTDVTTLSGDIVVQNRFWVFGDGGSATSSPNPLHTYTSVGMFTVGLELVTNYPSCNITEDFVDKIKVGNKPVASYNTTPAPPSACDPPLLVSFTNTSAGGTAPLSYAWNFGNGQTSTATNPPSQNYTAVGNYPVSLVVTDALGCTASVSANVSIGNPTAAFNVNDTLCLRQQVQIQNMSGAGTYAWTFGPNATPTSSSQVNPNVRFNTPGTHVITLTVTASGGCSSTLTQQIFVDDPNPAFTVAPTYSCSSPTLFNFNATSPAATAWLWSFSDGTTATTKSTTYNWFNPDQTGFSHAGLYRDTVVLIVTNASGCMDTLMKIDTVWLPNARFMPNIQHGCAPLTVTFADSSASNENIVEWSWLYDDGSAPQVVANGNDVTHTFNQPGEYEVRLVIRNAKGCIDTSYAVLIEVGEKIPGVFTVDKTEVCPGDTVRFINNTNDPRVDGWHFVSDGNRLSHCFNEPNPVWVYQNETGLQDVSLITEYNGCLETVTQTGLVQAKGPIAKINYKIDCDSSLVVRFENDSWDAIAFKWYFGDGDSSILTTPLPHHYDSAGTYTVVLIAENSTTGCPASRDSITVYPTELKAKFDLPDIICGGTPVKLDGSESTSVNATCYKGYTWYFSFPRPIRTDSMIIDYTFGPSGPQKVWLEVEDINGCKDTLVDNVTIYNREPRFEASDYQICVPATVNFTDFSTADTTVVSWEWDFGDGTTGTGPNPTHTYTSPPPNGQSYNVSLTIRDKADCPAFYSLQINYYEPESQIITLPQQPNLCVGEDVIFSATNFTGGGSGLTWTWNFGGGGTQTGQTVQQTFNTPGIIPVILNFTEIATGCQGSNTVNVDVQDFPNASFSTNVDGQSIICYPQNMALTSTSTSAAQPLSITWDFGNGLTSVGNTAATVFPKGMYSVTMTATTTYGCSDTTTRSFTVVGPEGNFTMDKNLICRGDAITFTLKDTADISSWSWSFGDGTTADNVNPVTHQYDFFPPSGTTLAKLILRGEDDACSFPVELPVNFSLVNADFTTAAPSVCFGVPHQFINNSTEADQSLWIFNNGPTSTSANPSFDFGAEGQFTVRLIVTDLPLGCRDTTDQLVLVTGLPNFNVVGDTICRGDTATIGLLTPLPGATFVWSPSNLVLDPKNAGTVQAKPTQTTNFIVSVTDASGCMDVDTARVFIPDGYGGARDLDTLVGKGEPVTLPIALDPFFNFEWMPNNPGPDLTVTPTDSSLIYTVLVKDQLGCTEETFEFIIRIVPVNINAPNVFTPGNNDDTNDFFVLIPEGEEGLVDVVSLKIFNRWGEVVFEDSGTDKTVKWDGTINGNPAPMDIYIWVASVKYKTGKEEVKKGDLLLAR